MPRLVAALYLSHLVVNARGSPRAPARFIFISSPGGGRDEDPG